MSAKATAINVRSAKLIQRFYRKYVKAQRDPVTHYPLDPISREGIMPHRRIRILMEGGANIQYFDVETLHQWFKTCRQPLNPLTNTNFTASQLGCILRAYNKAKMSAPIFIITPTAGTAWAVAGAAGAAAASSQAVPMAALPFAKAKAKAKTKSKPKPKPKAKLKQKAAAASEFLEDEDEEDGDEEDEEEENKVLLESKILLAAAMECDIEWIRNVLFNNVSGIQEGLINLNFKMPLMHTHPTVSVVAASSFVVKLPLDLLVTPLMCAVFYDNVAAVKELVYFNLDINAMHYNIRAADLALLSTQPNSFEILRWLLYYGGQLGSCFNYKNTVTDCKKLELVSSFC